MPIPRTDFDLIVIPQDLNSRDVVFLMAGTEESKVWKTQVFITARENRSNSFNWSVSKKI